MVFEKLLQGIDGGRVLDVACGTGQFTKALAGSLNSFDSITGVDVDETFLSEARHKFRSEKFFFLVASSQQLPFEDECFDLVAISKALHHVEDPEATLAEMKRVLRVGGQFLINEMHREGLTQAQESHMLYHHLRSEMDNILGISHNHTFHREDLIRLGDRLELKDRVMLEFNPDPAGAKDHENIEEFSRKMDDWIWKLEDYPEKSKFAEKVETLKSRFREHGISRPPQLVILGRK